LFCGILLTLAVACRGTSATPTAPIIATATLPPAATATRVAAPISDATLQLSNWHDMIYHPGLERLVLVNGGPEQGKDASDPLELWGWDDSAWRLIVADPAGPRWRNFAALTYDAGRGVLVLFGGLDGDGTELADLWEWDGQTWTERTAPGPTSREAAGLTYDAARGQTVLFGGAHNGRMQSEVWTWDGTTWTRAADGPAARFVGGFAFDSLRNVVWLFGGHSVSASGWQIYGDTWAWDGVAWTEMDVDGPSPRDGARAAYDPTSGRVLLFGGAQIEPSITFLAETWAWDGEQWTQLDAPGPVGRAHHSFLFDPSRGHIVMAGGAGADGAVLADMWEWDGQGWVCLAMCGE
jgi:hypothetical protein